MITRPCLSTCSLFAKRKHLTGRRSFRRSCLSSHGDCSGPATAGSADAVGPRPRCLYVLSAGAAFGASAVASAAPRTLLFTSPCNVSGVRSGRRGGHLRSPTRYCTSVNAAQGWQLCVSPAGDVRLWDLGTRCAQPRAWPVGPSLGSVGFPAASLRCCFAASPLSHQPGDPATDVLARVCHRFTLPCGDHGSLSPGLSWVCACTCPHHVGLRHLFPSCTFCPTGCTGLVRLSHTRVTEQRRGLWLVSSCAQSCDSAT